MYRLFVAKIGHENRFSFTNFLFIKIYLQFYFSKLPLSKISEFMVLYSVTSFKIPKKSKASKPTVISRNNATKTEDL
jgi:hypothetical protein